ncbi:uncharacterized protein [Arachis hypogaea]|uniref:uncharacterized protein n=1 Tax=Arachis hypogaea TaxID=3818 RepID=UPI000DEC8561
MATRGQGHTHSRAESRNEQPADNHAEFIVAMANLANTIEENAAVTLDGNGNDNAKGNGDNMGGAPMTLATFLKVHPPSFRGSTNPTEADNWFQAMDRALQAQHVLNNQYVEFAAYQLLGEVQHWWQGECRLLQLQNTDIPWDAFQTAFYKKYFSESAKEAKKMELMQLKQGSLFVAEYTNRFEELCRFSRVCQGAPKTYESWKCIKYQRDLKDNIMTTVAPMEIRIFSDLVNKPRVVEEYSKTYQRGKRRENQSKVSPDLICDRCGRFHPYDSCKIGIGGCVNYGLPGHIARDCTRGKNPNAGQSQHQGRVFAVNAKDAAKVDHLMRGNCLVGDKTLVALYDTGALHSFISFDKVEELGLKVSELAFELHMILGFDWLSKNRVLLDWFEWSTQFMPEGENGAVVAKGYYLNSIMVHCSGEECQGYILLATNALGDAQSLDQISVVRDFPEVFPEDILEFPPQKKIEFMIELVSGARPVLIAPYRMAPIEMA